MSEEIGLPLNPKQIATMVRLDHWVVRWSSAVRLIGFSTEEERFDRYFGEAVHASLWLPETGEAADVGSGGGTPALPLAICRPGVKWKLLEPNRKKAIFLEEVSMSLGLGNVEVRRERYESFKPTGSVRLVTTRGLSLDRDFLSRVEGWLDVGGNLCIFTAKGFAEEIAQHCGGGWHVSSKEPLAPRYESWLLILERSEGGVRRPKADDC